MFVAWRDLRFARGRFLLIGAVVALITLLVGFLSGLTGGLASQNISSVLAIPGDQLVLAKPATGQPSFASSTITEDQAAAWENASGVDSVLPIGITQSRGESADSEGTQGIALFGMPSPASPAQETELTRLTPSADDEIGLSSGAASALRAKTGDTVTITGNDYTVASVGGDSWYSHTPVVAMTPKAWSDANKRVGGTGEATVLAVTGDADWATIASDTDTSAATVVGSLTALEAFKSEIGSLGLMIALLFGISALVVGAFFTVWTMQRAGDVAVLKALGATTSSLVKDSLGQALVVLLLGIGVGLLAVVGFGSLAGTALPFLLSPLTTLAPAAIMTILGLGGAAVALRSVTKADPLTALGSHR
ncbi:ABC transporter permease [Leucobacter sp. CSA2]|uniref:ABC transporter permease n=1 Tax=Leucobacter edaphi TaxID=2796472 RepID=A0A934QA60_9MICO|nr:ABC transporter permease [Leucobacter edaphi]